MTIREIPTRPYQDQRSGTAGLRKKVSVFQQPHYLENFLQSVFDCMPSLAGHTLVMGGDGRYYNRQAIATAIAMAAANGVSRVVVGQGGILSTPAASHLICKFEAAGGLVFTASHNPAGPDGDFGIKLNVAGGGQAPESLTNRIYERSLVIERYRIQDVAVVDLDRRGSWSVGELKVDVVDCVDDYAQLMQSLFDFDRIRGWLSNHWMRFDAMHAVTGPYAKRIFADLLGAPASSVQNASPLEDFGGGHPDPNLIHARPLVEFMHSDRAADFAAASDGDGDRNLILGQRLFVSPGDSLAILAAHLDKLPGYRRGLSGVARSMPTSRALDVVARRLKVDCYETPTGWKFFANLLDSGRITLCGEESFGTSSNHVREKDGVWAVLAWLNVLAVTGLTVREIVQRHWAEFGRHYFQRHDYENLSGPRATQVMQGMANLLPKLAGQTFGDWTVTLAEEFCYQDPVDGSLAVNQGLRVVFGDRARIVLRMSGTGTSGSTLRLYLERFESAGGTLDWEPSEALAPLAAVAEEITCIAAVTGHKGPGLIT
jgi:phosphoglucomutase